MLKQVTYMSVVFCLSTFQAMADDYLRWPNGGGLVHKDAKIHSTAYIVSSTIGPHVTIENQAVIMSSSLGVEQPGETGSGTVYVEQGAVIKSSNVISGRIRNAAVVLSSKVEGNSLVGDGAVVISSGVKSGTSLGDRVFISSSSIEGNSIVGSRAVVLDSILSNLSSMGYYAVLHDSIAKNRAALGQFSFIQNSTVDGNTVQAYGLLQNGLVKK